MISVYGSDIYNVFTYGEPVKSVFADGVKVWKDPEYSYYIYWWPSTTSGSFSFGSEEHRLRTFKGLYEWETGIITSSAFKWEPFQSISYIYSISTNATVINEDAFRWCQSLTKANMSYCTYIGNSAFYQTKLSRVYLPVCSYVGSYAFCRCSCLESISLPQCSYIGSDAFHGCSSLEGISLPQCSYIGSGAFSSGCSSLSYATLPNVEYVGMYAFCSCRLLTSISLPQCSYIGRNAFYDCQNISSVTLPVCTRIGMSAFYNCFRNSEASGMSMLDLPECSVIESGAFQSCYYLKSISLPKCSWIKGSNTFAWCSRLMVVYITYSSVCELDSYWAFEGTSANLRIYVPSSLYTAYKTATHWASISSRIYSIP